MRWSGWGSRGLPVVASAALAWAVGMSPAGAAAGWQVVASPDGTANDAFGAVFVHSPTDIWAAGTAYGTSSDSNGLIEHYDGSAWAIVPSPTPSGARYTYLTGLSGTSASDVWAVGFDLISKGHTQQVIEHYDGSAWTQATAPASFGPAAVTAVSASDVWAVGGKSGVMGIEHYDGTAWSTVAGSAAGYLAAVTAVSATDLWAVGYQGGSGLATHYDGTAWTPVTVPAPAAASGGSWELTAAVATSASDVWAAGYAQNAADTADYPIVEHFDGTSWAVTQLPALSASYPYETLSAVDAISPGDVWATGLAAVGDAAQTTAPLVEHFDGTSWSIASAPGAGGQELDLSALAHTSSGQLWAVGGRRAPGSTASQTFTASYG